MEGWWGHCSDPLWLYFFIFIFIFGIVNVQVLEQHYDY